jgi:hypothetical protein
VSTSPLFYSLIDDAALFPPGNAPMEVAVPAHREHGAAWYAHLIGPFLCPASRLTELAAQLGSDAPEFGVAVIVDTGTDGIGPAVDEVAADHRLTLRGVEVPLRGGPGGGTAGGGGLRDAARRTVAAVDAALGGPEDDAPSYIEIPRTDGWQDALEIVAESGYRAKLRTGGPSPDTFPSEPDIARFIVACLELDVPFKFTAGLHHAVRRTTPDGREEHGFLNALLAVAAALDGADVATIARVLAQREAAALVERADSLPAERASSVRAWFGSYGSCSVNEPIDDLLDLKLISH